MVQLSYLMLIILERCWVYRQIVDFATDPENFALIAYMPIPTSTSFRTVLMIGVFQLTDRYIITIG